MDDSNLVIALLVVDSSSLPESDKQLLESVLKLASPDAIEAFLYLYEEDNSGISTLVNKIRRWRSSQEREEQLHQIFAEEEQELTAVFS